jgi:Predicted integral membrane protein
MKFVSIALSLIVCTGSAIAQQRPQPGFRACNLTTREIEVAKALDTGVSDGNSRIIISEGWYKLPPNACTFLWAGPLQYDRYLVYAQDKSTGREWSGTVPVCVSPQAFTIRANNCGSEYQRRLFTQVSTRGQNGWIHNFTP